MKSTCLTKSWAYRDSAFWRILLALLLALGLALSARGPAYALTANELNSAYFFSKYTYNGLESDPADASRKSVAFAFSSPHPVERLSLELLQPRGASDFASDPPATTTRQDARSGFSYHQVVSGPLAVGQELAVLVHNSKADPALSVLRQAQVEEAAWASGAEGEAAAGIGVATMGLAVGEVPTWLALLFGAITVVGIVRLARRGTRPARKQVPAQKQGSAKRQKRAGTQTAAHRPNWPVRYCPGCGEHQMVGALYCNRCGGSLIGEMKLEPAPIHKAWNGCQRVRRVGR